MYETAVLGPLKYDKVFHAAATGVAAWASFEALTRWGGRPTPGLALAAVLMASNNMLDVFANTAGAVVGAIWAHIAAPRRTPDHFVGRG